MYQIATNITPAMAGSQIVIPSERNPAIAGRRIAPPNDHAPINISALMLMTLLPNTPLAKRIGSR